MPSKKRSPVKLIDVANEAEVSIATVSLALRDDPSISEGTRRRVQEAQKRLGYQALRRRSTSQPPPVARRKEASCGSLLYCIVDFPVRKYQYADFLEGVMEACREKKIRLELKSVSAEQLLSETSGTEAGVDGVILTGELKREVVDAFLKNNPRTLILGNYSFSDVHRVELDLLGIGDALAERVARDGHKEIIHLVRDSHNLFERRFLGTMREALAAQGVELPLANVIQVENLFDALGRAVDKILAANPRVTAITSDASNIAEACLTEIRCRLGKNSKTPSPVAYTVGFGGGGVPGVHVLDIGLEHCGWLAVERLCQLYQSPTPFPFSSVVPIIGWREEATQGKG